MIGPELQVTKRPSYQPWLTDISLHEVLRTSVYRWGSEKAPIIQDGDYVFENLEKNLEFLKK